MGNAFKNPFVMIFAGVVIGGIGLAATSGTFQQVASNVSKTSPIGRLVSNMPNVKVTEVPKLSGPGLTTLRELDQAFADLAQNASLGVVSIANGDPQSGGGQGSGFVYRSDGWIVTNSHVVSGADTVTVVLNDGRQLEGKVYEANDNQIDLAVVKVDAKNLPALPLADSSKVVTGQFSIAVGAPFGLQNSVTVGHVSALDRGSAVFDQQIGSQRGYTGLIQTDAPINPGNSGGPLLDIEGKVIGVNSTIVSTTMASAGIGFSIPSNVVSAVADELIETGKFDRGLLGAGIRDVLPYEKDKFKVKGGAFIESLQTDGPAEAAGLKVGDVVTAIDGHRLHTQLDLRIALYRGSPGKSAAVEYVRDGATKNVQVKLSAPESSIAQERQSPQMGSPFSEQSPWRNFDPGQGQGQERAAPGRPVRLGVAVRNIDDTMREQYNLDAGAKGVVVTAVSSGSFADQIGLEPGDVVTELNGETVAQVADIGKAMQGVSSGDRVTVKALRSQDGAKTTIEVTEQIR